MKTQINAVLNAGVKSGAVPGVVAAVANREGVLYEGAFGERALGSGNAMTNDTVCWIASMTKAITSVAAVQCVERGHLKLDEPAKNICPELGKVGVLTGFDAHGKPLTRAPKRDITLRQLLTHSAGFSYEIWNTDMQKVQAALEIPSVTECKNKALTLPLLFDPGEGWEYGINIDWAGKMIEKVSGQTLGQYLKHNIFDPLGMSSTGFHISDDMRSRLATTHLRGPDGNLSVFPFEIPQQPEFEMGGGGLYSTAGDYLKFLRMVLNHGQLGGERILTPEGTVSLGLNHMGDCRVYNLKGGDPAHQRCRIFPGCSQELEPGLPNQPRGHAHGSPRWRHDVGRFGQLVLLGRPNQWFGRGVHHANLPVCRSQIAAALLRL